MRDKSQYIVYGVDARVRICSHIVPRALIKLTHISPNRRLLLLNSMLLLLITDSHVECLSLARYAFSLVDSHTGIDISKPMKVIYISQ